MILFDEAFVVGRHYLRLSSPADGADFGARDTPRLLAIVLRDLTA